MTFDLPLKHLLVGMAVVMTGALSALEPASGKHPHILLILVDDMGYGDPGCYNSESKIETPNIDRLAAAGMRFTDAHASGPLCHMSRYGLMTGRYPFRIDVNRWRKQPLIESGEVTIASLLKSSGYRTAMVGKWHLGFDEQGYDRPLRGGPADCGFDTFFGIRASTDIPPYFYIRDHQAVAPPTETIEANSSEGWSPIQGAFWRKGNIAPELELKDVLPKFTDEACQVIQSHANRQDPLMLYVAFPAPHTPWLPSKEFAGRSKAGMYGDFTMMVDACVGRILERLDAAGMADDTLVMLSSDNGPVWYETDVERFGHDSSGGLRGMKADAWECGHRMPFIVRWPEVVKAGSSSNKLISFVDVLATLDELVDGKTYSGESLRGGPDSFSFLGELTGTKSVAPQRKSLLLRSGRGLMTIRRGDWKLIDGNGSGGFSGRERRSDRQAAGTATDQPAGQLYHLGEDIAETQNRFESERGRVRDLKAEMDRVVAEGRSRE